ncbi:MAG: hypothetical protein ACE15C_10955 [Phycisphaerae bacterium]
MRGNATLAGNCDRRSTWYRRAAAFCAMLAVAMVFRADALTDWDSWDYASQAMLGQPSDLALGRWWFIAALRAMYAIGHGLFGVARLDGYLAMQIGCSIVMALALVALMAWTHRLTRSTAAEVIVAALVLPGPMIGIYASSVMTEGLAVLMITCAFLAWDKVSTIADCGLRIADSPGTGCGGIGEDPANPKSEIRNPKSTTSARRIAPFLWALTAGLCLGVAIDIREPAILLGAWPVISCLADRPQHRWRLLILMAAGAAIALGIGVAGAWAWYPWSKGYLGNMHEWLGKMAAERTQFPPSVLENLGLIGLFLAIATPLPAVLALPSIIWALLRRRRLFWLAVSVLPYLASLAVNHDLSVNPRFIIPAAWLLSPVAAAAVDAWLVGRRRWQSLRLGVAAALVIGLGGAGLVAGWGEIQRTHFDYSNSQARMLRVMLKLPDDTAVIPGPGGTPVAGYLNRLGVKHFSIVRSGWDWPGDKLGEVISGHLAAGRRVFIDLDEKDWTRTLRKNDEFEALLAAIDRGRFRQVAASESTWPLTELLPPTPASRPATLRLEP